MLYAVLHCNEWCTVRYISGQRNTDKGGCGRANSQMKDNVLIVGWGGEMLCQVLMVNSRESPGPDWVPWYPFCPHTRQVPGASFTDYWVYKWDVLYKFAIVA